MSNGPCGLCGKDPSEGLANITVGDKRVWLCHDVPKGSDKRSCYVRWTVYNERPDEKPNDYHHVAFNPTPLGMAHSPLGDICREWERDGWRLIQIVPHHMYESIAVFGRTRGEAE